MTAFSFETAVFYGLYLIFFNEFPSPPETYFIVYWVIDRYGELPQNKN